MACSRRTLLSALAGASAVGLAQTYQGSGATTGFKADNEPGRTECGIGALMPWADALWPVTYNSHMKAPGSGLGLYRIGDDRKS
jgi:hypothetical protein